MLSFKGLAGFLKRVSTSGRDDTNRDQKQKGGGDAGTSTGAGSNNNSGAVSGAGDGAKGLAASRAAVLGIPGTHGSGRKGEDNGFTESPLFGMPSAFGDTSMFTSSSILKGLPPNATTQDVLRHIQRVVQERAEELQYQEDNTAAAGLDNGDDDDDTPEPLLNPKARNVMAAPAAAMSSAARNSLEGSSPRSSHSLVFTAAPSPSDVSPITTSGARPGANFASEPAATAPSTTAPTAVMLASISCEKLQVLQSIRGEMIDALDVCLQEVPEAVAQAPLTEEEKARLEKLAAAGDGSVDGRTLQEPMTRSNSIVLPSSFTGGQSGLLLEGTGAGGAADAQLNWDEGSSKNALLDGLHTGAAAMTPRNGSVSATPMETAELSTVTVPCPDTSAASPPASAAPIVFTHYEWRCLLLQIVEVLVRIDCALMQEVRRRAMQKLAPGVAAPSSSAAGTKAPSAAASGSLTPTHPAQPIDVPAASTAIPTLNSPHLAMSRSEGMLRTPEGAESLTLPTSAALIAVASGHGTPRESVLPLGGPNTASTTTTAAAASVAASPSPIAKTRRALEETCVSPSDNRLDYSISKEDKKMLEELLTVACSLATWAIIKAILRHHLQLSSGSRLRNSRKATAGGGTAAGSSDALGSNMPAAGAAERPILDMSLSATTTDLGSTGSSAASGGGGGGGGRLSLPPLPPPPAVPPTVASGSTDEAATTDDAALSPRRRPLASEADPSDDIPYIDWEAVVQELDEWMGSSPGHIVAECTLCASFLRDDGREMVMCMLQKPKPRCVLSSIHRHAEKLRHTDPMAAAAVAVAPVASPRVTVTAASPGSAAGPSSGLAPPSSATTPSPITAATTNTASTAAGAAGAAAASTTSAGGGGSTVASVGVNTGGAASFQSMMDDPTLVMDDLVAQLELVYRKAVGDTWSNFLEGAIEAEIRSVQFAAPLVSAAGLPASSSEAATTDRSGTDGEKTSPAAPQGGVVAGNFSEDPLCKAMNASITAAQGAPSALESPLTKAYITDAKTLCRLATAYFFGSDAWSEKKRERRFAVLYRSMRTRMEHYSESAATRRNVRRGTSSAASPTQTATTTAVASPVDACPCNEPVAASAMSQLQQRTPRTSVASAGPTILVTQASELRPSPTQNNASSSTTVPPPAGAANTTAVVLMPTKLSVEDTSPRAVYGTMASTTAAVTSNAGSPTTTAASATMPRHGALSTQLVAHQLLSSNASNVAASSHSTPLAGSLQMSRDCCGSDGEGAPASSALHSMHPSNISIGADRYTLSTTEQPASWTPFGFVMTSPGTVTPLPEADQMSCQQQQQQQLQQQMASVGATPLRSEGDSNIPSFAAAPGSSGLPLLSGIGGAAGASTATPSQPPPSLSSVAFIVGAPLNVIVLERIVNMSWSAALHKRGEQCLNAKPPRLEEAEQNAQEERLVAGAFGEFRARQRSLVSLINARLASGKSVEALSNAQKHFRFEKKDWTSYSQTIFSALRYLQSMVLLVRAQAACRVYGAVIETVQFVLPQATLCEQMLQVIAPRPRRDCIIRFADCRSKLLRSYVYLLKECWLAHAAFNDHTKAAKYFSQCVQVLQMLRRRSRESELFAAYMERGTQLMKMKDYKKSVELFQLAVNMAKKSLKDADAAVGANSAGTSAAPSLGSTMTSMANPVPTTPQQQQQFHRNMHFRGAGSGLLYTAEEHSVGTSAAMADDLEFAWRVAESERMLALSYVTQAEHEVNVRERREELSNAVSNAYSSQRSLQRWQTKGGTPKRLLTAVPCSLIVICKGLLLLNQARKAALLLEPLIENKPSSALVRPPMWREILDPTEDPYTAEDVVLRTYVCSVKIAVYMLYARCLAEFDGERALRAVTLVDQLLQESDAWIYTMRTQLRRALEEVRAKDKSGARTPTSPYITHGLELTRVTAPVVAAMATKTTAANNDDNEDTLSTMQQCGGGADTVVSAASTNATAGTGVTAAATISTVTTNKTTDVPPLRILNMEATRLGNSSNVITSIAAGSSLARVISSAASHNSPEYNSPEEAPLRQRRSNVANGGGGGVTSSIALSRDDLLHDEDEHSRHSTVMHTSVGSVNTDTWNYGNANTSGAIPAGTSLASLSNNNASSTNAGQQQQASTNTPILRMHMESASECMTALFALREGKSHIRKALRDIFIVSGDAHSLIKNWEEALKSYSHALVISMSEVEAANAAAKSRRQINHYATPRSVTPPLRNLSAGGLGGGAAVGNGAHYEESSSLAASQVPASAAGVASATHAATAGGAGSSRVRGGGGCAASTTTTTVNNNGASVMDSQVGPAAPAAGNSTSSTQCWGQVVPLDEEFYLWDEEDGLIADNMVSRDLAASTAAKDLRAVVADEERMDSRACESLVLSKLANVYRALDKPTTAIHYHNLVLDYANECHDTLLAYNSMLSLARLYTAAGSLDEARDTWAKVSDLAKEYEDKEVSRETKRNIVVGQESAGMYLDVVKTAEELEKLAMCEEGEDAAADRRFALEALANANLQLGQYEACITALDNREKVQEKSAEWNGRLLSMRAKARMGLNKPADAIKVMQSWAAKARNLGNWVELGKANSALSAAFASENQNMQARHYHEATLTAFSLAETLNEDCQHIALDSARWLVHYAYLDDATVQVDPSLTYSGGCLTSDSEVSGGDFRYTDSGLCNISGDLGEMLAKEEEMRRSSSSLISDSLRGRIGSDNDEDDFFGSGMGSGSGGTLSNHSLFGMRCPNLADSDRLEDGGEEKEEEGNINNTGEADAGASGSSSGGAAAPDSDGAGDGTDGNCKGEGDEEENKDEDDGLVLQRHTSTSFHPKDPACATQPPSLASSVNHSLHEYPAAQQDNLDLNFSGSSAGQSEVGDNDALVEENEDEVRRRREVDEALRTMDEDVEALQQQHSHEGAAATVAAAVAAAAQNNIFFNMEDDDTMDPKSSSDGKGGAAAGGGKSTAASSATPPMPNITTAAVKPSGNAAAAGATKSASSNYVPPPTALANVSICSRPAAAAAGTDVLELPVDSGRSTSEQTSGSGSTGSPLIASNSNGRGGNNGGASGAGFGESRDGTMTGGGALLQQDGDDAHRERKPATVRTTYYRGAVEMMETAAQLLLVPRSVSRMVVPYSPAEAVDFALLSHPHSLFVFYFAEYTTEYGAQCDVVVRPPGTAGFLKLRTQISLKEYHSKDVVKSLLTTLSAESSVAIAASNNANSNADPACSASHPFGGAIAKAAAAAPSGGSGSAGASPTLSNFSPDALRAALDDETRSCLRNLHADAWQPIIDRMHREHISYEDSETVIIMPDIALLHLPFAGLLPSPDYGGEEAPLGEQFTLIVTPSLTHFVYHGMTEQQLYTPPEHCGALDPSASRYIFIPYDATNTGGAVGVGGQLSVGTAAPSNPSAPSSPRPRQQQHTSLSAKLVGASAVAGNPSSSGVVGKHIHSASSAASPSSWPPVTPAHSNDDSTLTAQTSAIAAGGVRRDSALGTAAGDPSVPTSAAPPADDGTFDGMLRTWRVHRGCTRKELIHAFTDCHTRALMFLGPIDLGGVRVADGVVTMQDVMQKLQQARSQPATAQSGGAGTNIENNNNINPSSSVAVQPHVVPSTVTTTATSSAPSLPLPPLCTHMDLLVLTADRGLYPSVTNGGMTASLCMSLGVHRVLRLNIVHELAPNDEHREFIAQYFANLRKVMRWKLNSPYAVALRTTIAEARAKGMSSNTWGAFTLVGSA
jgi:tetratricopeptide (TPR) repeat protein